MVGPQRRTGRDQLAHAVVVAGAGTRTLRELLKDSPGQRLLTPHRAGRQHQRPRLDGTIGTLPQQFGLAASEPTGDHSESAPALHRQSESNPISLLRAALWSGIYTPGYVASVLLLIGGMGVITRFGACSSLKKSEATERISLSKRSLDRKTSLD